MGYHLKKIDKGVVGEISKIKEECDELVDASSQKDCDILILVELSDLVGAIDAYLKKYHPTIEIKHLEAMAERTASAFRDGER